MPRTPPLNAIKAFEASARHLNFRLAAEELSVTQGAVAQQVRALEAYLDIKLFQRLSRGLSLTEEGRVYFSPIQKAMNLITEATDNLHPVKHIVNISVTPSFASKWLVPRLHDFTKTYPDIDIRISASETIANFRSDNIDIAIRLGRPPFPANLVAELLYPEQIIAVCSPVHFSKDTNLKTPDDLANHVLLHDGHGYWSAYFENAGIRPKTSDSRMLKFNQTSLAIDAAIAGQGIALTPPALVEDDLRTGRLYSPFKISIDTDRGFYVLTQKSSAHPDLMAKMNDWLLSQSRSS